MNNAEMINYLSKEIETLAKNTMDARSKISFSLLIGPFLVLGSIIVSTPKTGWSPGLHSPSAWIAAGVAVCAFWALGIIAGHIEEGAWQKCNQWRQCIIKIQNDVALSEDQLEELILEQTVVKKVARAYTGVFLLILITFGATAYLAAKLVSTSTIDSPKPQVVATPSP
jgi:hypothetical protein